MNKKLNRMMTYTLFYFVLILNIWFLYIRVLLITVNRFWNMKSNLTFYPKK